MTGVSQLPVEVLYHIFELSKKPRPYNMYIPQRRLSPLIRVCKHWKPIAERLLYQSVAIGSDLLPHDNWSEYDRIRTSWTLERTRAQDGPICLASVIVARFLETIEKNQRLAAIVAELQLLIPADGAPEEQTQRFSKILTTCPNVKHLKIITLSTHPNAGSILLEALLLKESLVSFKLDTLYCARIADPLWKASDVLRMMRKWRQIEHVQASPDTLNYHCPDDEEETEEGVELGCCPKLQTFALGLNDCRRALFRSRDLQDLLNMCPAGIRIFKASLTMDAGTLEALGDCIRAWAPTLENLNLRGSLVDETTSSPPLSDSVAGLTRLKILALETLVLDPCVLSTLPNLTGLCISSLVGRYRRRLLLVMNDPRMFSALRTFHIRVCGSTPLDQEEDRLYDSFYDDFESRDILYEDDLDCSVFA